MILAIEIALALQAAPVADVRRLGWLEGDWHCYAMPPARSGPRRFEEYWVYNRGGWWVGAGRLIHFRTRSLEHMRIAPDAAGRLTFYGSPGGAAPVAFPLVRMTADEVVFENPAHDFPQRISYRHEPNRLIATVSRLDGSGAQTWRYTNSRGLDERRAPCNEPD